MRMRYYRSMKDDKIDKAIELIHDMFPANNGIGTDASEGLERVKFEISMTNNRTVSFLLNVESMIPDADADNTELDN